MLTENEMNDYLDSEMATLKFMCQTGQWDGITESQINTWLNNFHDTEGRYFALKILLNSLYYNEEDMVILLRHGLFNKIYGSILKKKLIENKNIFLTLSELVSMIMDMLNHTLFIPLLDKDKPYESGNQISRILTQQMQINGNQVMFHYDVIPKMLKNIKYVVIVDDTIGSGDQVSEFWNKKMKEIRESSNNVQFFYLVIAAYEKGIIDSIKSLENLNVVPCDLLTEKNRVFSVENEIWHSKEFDSVKKYFTEIQKNRGIPMFGYKGLDFSIIMHKNIPDWSLPIFWKKSFDWKALISRKNS